MAMAEGAALDILPDEANGGAFGEQGAKCQGFGGGPIEGLVAAIRFGAITQNPLKFG